MNIKDKLTICLIIISVIVLGFVLKSNADNFKYADKEINNDKDLAVLAKEDIDKFINTEPESSWFNTVLALYGGENDNDATIAQSSAACMYHVESGYNGSTYNIINVININWDETKNDYHAYGWWADSSSKDGISGNELTSINKDYSKLFELDVFLQAMYNAYISNKTLYTTTEKSAMKSCFYDGIKENGFLTVDDGKGLNIEKTFIEPDEASEALSFWDKKDPKKTASDLIEEYSKNSVAGYGLTINGESTCIKEKDTDNDYTIFGPFNIYFQEPIDNISIDGETKSWNTNKDGKDIYYSYDKKNWSNEYSNIQPNKDFYIKISDSDQNFYSQSSNIIITFNQKELQTYKARFILLKSNATNGQNLMIYAAKKNPSYEPKVQYGVKEKDIVEDTTLRVVKYGLRTGGYIDTSNKQSGVGFIINNTKEGYLQCNEGSGYKKDKDEKHNRIIVKQGKMEYNEDNFAWTTDRNEATIFETVNTVENGSNWDGYFQISNMPPGEYFIGEIYNSNSSYENGFIKSYRLEYNVGDSTAKYIDGTDIQKSENISGYTTNKMQVINVELEADGYIKVLRVYDTLNNDSIHFNITLNKVKKTSGMPLGGAKFKIKVLDATDETTCWLKKSDTGYNYESKYTDATVWCTTANKNVTNGDTIYAETKGVISIENLSTEYEYEIYEIEAGQNCYSLVYQVDKGMSVSINKKNVDIEYQGIDMKIGRTDVSIVCGSTSWDEHGSNANIIIENVAPNDTKYEFVDISGIVWLDGEGNKDDGGSGSYGDEIDEWLSNVNVYLKKVSNNEIVKSTKTNDDGYYIFDGDNTKIKSSNLSKYYIEVEYDKIGTKYGLVGFGTGEKESKAIYQGKGCARTDAIIEEYSENMNVGLRELPTTEESVEKWVDKVVVKMKGKEYTYKYGKDNTGVGGVSGVGIGNASYYRTIYSSDIIYSKQTNATGGLEVYITYEIRVSNDTSTYKTAEVVGNIKENNMTVTLTDEYDSNYYELSDKNWNGSNGVATYNESITLNRKIEGVTGNETIVPITFKLTDGTKGSTKDALKKILSDGSFTASNKAKISGKHNYSEYISYQTSGWIKMSNGSYVYDTITKYKWSDKSLDCSKETYAPGMTFSIYEQDGKTVAQRTISGTVFEDENIESTGKIQGDGKYDVSASNKEKSIENVKVDLMLYVDGKKITGEDQEVATRYICSETEDEDTNIVREGTAVTKSEYTTIYGTYTFEGIIPGDYYIRFTYGNGNQIIRKANNLTIDDRVMAYEYKSTIMTNSTLKKLIKKDRNSENYNDDDYYWYKNLTINGYSTAVDILSDRETFNGQRNKKYDIRAYTPTLKIEIENTETKNEIEFKDFKDIKEYKIQNINFGIIDTPEIELGFEKVMTNIRVTNTSGQIIIDGNPGEVKKKIKYLSNLDDKVTHLTQGSDNAKIEINNEELYGAKLEITYAITIINNSDVNYYEKTGSNYYGYYYMFGEIHEDGGDNNKTHEVNITIDSVLDNLDKKLEIMGNDHEISNINTYKDTEYILNLNGGDWKKIYTGIVSRTDSKPTQDIAILIATRTLSNEDTNIDITFENIAEVKEIHVTDEPKLVEDVNKHLTSQYNNYFKYEISGIKFDNPSEYNSLIVIPPTGSDKITPIIYIITTVISGIIIAIGVIVIKKKVLNK